uniref:Tetratricopeptide repeat protein 1-like n=1 Tax=Tetraselmis sp. GSL018 TaxID=582737 RepID=A0A061S0W4_9CHLO
MGCEDVVQVLKEQGNTEYKKQNFLKAAALYSRAIKEDPNNAVLFSNRAEALLQLKKVTKALQDAEECIKLKPDWEKGYFRKGSVLESMERYAEALEAYEHAASLKPDNRDIQAKVKNMTRYIRKLQQKQNI